MDNYKITKEGIIDDLLGWYDYIEMYKMIQFLNSLDCPFTIKVEKKCLLKQDKTINQD
jgi:hypothetical protein